MHGSSHTSVAAALSLAGPGVSTRHVQVRSAPGPTSFGACCPPGDPCPQAPLSDGGTLGICSAAAAIAKLLQSCLTLCDPIDGSPPGSAFPGILQARTLEWVAISFSRYVLRTWQLSLLIKM